MSQRVCIGKFAEFPDGVLRLIDPEGVRIAVVRRGEQIFALADRCPHRGASLSRGTLDGETVSCPLHHFRFHLADGRCEDDPAVGARRFEVFVAGAEVFLDLTPVEPQIAPADDISRYLVRYGAMGWVGRFGSPRAVECSHGDRVIVQTRRGLELGEVLLAPGEGIAAENPARPSGEVHRSATPDDVQNWQSLTVPPALMPVAVERLTARQLPIDVIDVELLFDGRSAVLYYLGRKTRELQPVVEELEQQFGLNIHFDPVLEPDESESPHGCGGGGCGSGGCSTGGCGSVPEQTNGCQTH